MKTNLVKPLPVVVIAFIVVLVVATTWYFQKQNLPSSGDPKEHGERPLVDPNVEITKSIIEGVKGVLVPALKEVFQPRVVIDQHVVIQENIPTIELALSSREIAADYSYKNSLLGSSKEFTIRATYIAKAGFKLSRNSMVEVEVDTKTMRMVAKLPEPQLLSLSQKTFQITHDENGLWNKLTAKEREDAINSLVEEGKRMAEKSGLLSDVKAAITTKVTNALQRSEGKEIDIQFPAKLVQ